MSSSDLSKTHIIITALANQYMSTTTIALNDTIHFTYSFYMFVMNLTCPSLTCYCLCFLFSVDSNTLSDPGSESNKRLCNQFRRITNCG